MQRLGPASLKEAHNQFQGETRNYRAGQNDWAREGRGGEGPRPPLVNCKCLQPGVTRQNAQLGELMSEGLSRHHVHGGGKRCHGSEVVLDITGADCADCSRPCSYARSIRAWLSTSALVPSGCRFCLGALIIRLRPMGWSFWVDPEIS